MKLLAPDKVQVDERYRTEYRKSCRIFNTDITGKNIDTNIDKRLENYLIHWTRASNEPWPGETKYEYYDSIIRAKDRYPRTALDTLIRILAEKQLRASGKNYRKGMTAVAFSELPPSKALKLMKWRARYCQMTFEPYGIAFDRIYCESKNIKPVLYRPSGEYGTISEADKPYFQSKGTKGSWAPEKEWRHIGHFDFRRANSRCMKLIVRNKNEIKKMRRLTNSEIISLNI
jgi:hypothetical protein